MKAKNQWLENLRHSIKGCYSSDWFAADRSFLTLKSFWTPFLIILIVFVALFSKVVTDENLIFGFDATVTDWYDWFKIPLWVLALLIPVLGLFNANHKSEQAKAALELTKIQNNFANYYKHIEEFKKYVENLQLHFHDGVHEIEVVVNSHFLHSQLYPDAKEKGLRMVTAVPLRFKELACEAAELFLAVTNSNDEIFHANVGIRTEEIQRILETQTKDSVSFDASKENDAPNGWTVEGSNQVNLIDLFLALNSKFQVYLRLYSFDAKFDEHGHCYRLFRNLEELIGIHSSEMENYSTMTSQALIKQLTRYKEQIRLEINEM